jgi:hypothetical protein
MGLRLAMLCSVAMMAVPHAALADTAPTPEALALAAKFGAREGIESVSLSPDGNLLALVTPDGDGEKVQVYNFVTGRALKPILANPHRDEHVTSCRWPTSNRLFCSIVVHADDTGTLVTFSRVIGLDADGRNLAMVTPKATLSSLYFGSFGGGVIDWNGARPGQVLMTRQYVPEQGSETRLAETGEGLAVDSVDVANLTRTTVELPRPMAAEFITDGLGQVRVMGCRTGVEQRLLHWHRQLFLSQAG